MTHADVLGSLTWEKKGCLHRLLLVVKSPFYRSLHSLSNKAFPGVERDKPKKTQKSVEGEETLFFLTWEYDEKGGPSEVLLQSPFEGRDGFRGELVHDCMVPGGEEEPDRFGSALEIRASPFEKVRLEGDDPLIFRQDEDRVLILFPPGRNVEEDVIAE